MQLFQSFWELKGRLENSQSLEVMGNGRISYLRRAAEGSGSEPEEPTKAPSFPQTPKPVTEPEPETEPKEEPKKEPTQAPSVGSTLVLTNIKNFADKFRPGL